MNKSKYSFEWYLKEHCRYGWLAPHNTPETLKEKYFDFYLEYCKEHNFVADTKEESDKYLYR